MKKYPWRTDKINAARVLTPAQQKAVLSALKKLLREHFEKNQSAASRELRISQQVINAALNTGKVGRGLADAVLAKLETTLDKLVAASVDAWPNRTLAVPLAEEDGATKEQIAEVLAVPFDGTPDLSRVAWALRMRPKT